MSFEGRAKHLYDVRDLFMCRVFVHSIGPPYQRHYRYPYQSISWRQTAPYIQLQNRIIHIIVHVTKTQKDQ